MAVKTLPELKVSDLVREYKSSFEDGKDVFKVKTSFHFIARQRSLNA
ncbi:MAG TPA: hypothetical protein VL122_13580 [Nitrospirota bacterium]|nr:hypothetical protein [Nitrospirota bacterium]